MNLVGTVYPWQHVCWSTRVSHFTAYFPLSHDKMVTFCFVIVPPLIAQWASWQINPQPWESLSLLTTINLSWETSLERQTPQNSWQLVYLTVFNFPWSRRRKGQKTITAGITKSTDMKHQLNLFHYMLRIQHVQMFTRTSKQCLCDDSERLCSALCHSSFPVTGFLGNALLLETFRKIHTVLLMINVGGLWVKFHLTLWD